MKRLTTPEEMNLVRRLHPTGNHFVSLPTVNAADGSVGRVGVLHMGTASLVEFGGIEAELGAETLPPLEPLIRPFVVVGGRKVYPGAGSTSEDRTGELTWSRRAGWFPSFIWTLPGDAFRLRGTLAAPVYRDSEGLQSRKGFVYVLEVQPGGGSNPERVGLDIAWGTVIQTIYTSRPVPAEFSVRRDRWTQGPVLEPRGGQGAGPVALAISFSAGPGDVEWTAGGTGRVPGPGDAAGAAGRASGPVVRLEIRVRPSPDGPTAAAAVYFGINREGDGARTAAIDLARRGWRGLLAESETAVTSLLERVPSISGGSAGPARPEGSVGTAATAVGPTVEANGLAGADSPSDLRALNERMRLNLLFNYFFAAGRTIDTEELALVTSRSPLYYVSAAFWARDALLWSYPGLLLLDPGLAEEAIGLAFDRYFHHAGIHSLYMDGRLLYPGFELDELAAYPIALRHYVEATGDRDILERRNLVPKLRRVLSLLGEQACPDHSAALYRTFLLPSDDPATCAYVTYDNVMAWRALLDTARLFRLAGGEEGLSGSPACEADALEVQAARVRESIYRHCVVEVPTGTPAPAGAKMFTWATDLAGGIEIADEPPGSLEILTHYGFCPPDDEIWLNTIGWLHSLENPYRYTGVPFPGLGCPHAKHPFVMSLFNALLGGRQERVNEAWGVLARAPLDTGLACESFDRTTGEVKTGAAFATCAGFLGYAMAVAGSR